MTTNAILIANDEAYGREDFLAIGAEMRRLAPDIRVHHVWKDRFSLGAHGAQLLRPTLSIMLTRTTRYWPLRGAVARSRTRGKLESYRVLEAAGVPLPRWTVIEPGTRLDPDDWGEWVVVKPARGRRGEGIEIVRSELVAYRPPESYPEGHAGRKGPMLAQRFVYTGPWPNNYRVLTCFGETVFCGHYEMHHELQAPLPGPEALGDGERRQIVTSPRGPDDCSFVSTGTLSFEADVIDLAKRIHAALGEVPMVGADILRDARSGELFVAEANQGAVWSVGGPRGHAWQARGLDGYGQFGAIAVAAKAMVEATRRLAR